MESLAVDRALQVEVASKHATIDLSPPITKATQPQIARPGPNSSK